MIRLKDLKPEKAERIKELIKKLEILNEKSLYLLENSADTLLIYQKIKEQQGEKKVG